MHGSDPGPQLLRDGEYRRHLGGQRGHRSGVPEARFHQAQATGRVPGTGPEGPVEADGQVGLPDGLGVTEVVRRGLELTEARPRRDIGVLRRHQIAVGNGTSHGGDGGHQCVGLGDQERSIPVGSRQEIGRLTQSD